MPSPTTRSPSTSPARSTRARVAERHFVATASCGICGKASLDEVEVRCDPIPAGPVVEPSIAARACPMRLREAQAVFEQTGGLHAAGLFDADRLARRAARGRRPPQRARQARRQPAARRARCRSTTGSSSCRGRASFELVQKAAVAGVPILAAVSAPSDLAVEAAERLGVTLVGFLRGDGFNVYAHPERIASDGAPRR